MKRAPLIAGSGDRINASVLDEWSLVHFASGFIAGGMGINAWLYVFGHTAYEVAEYAHESPNGSKLFGSKHPEWDVNMVSDLAVAFTGYALAAWLSGRSMSEPKRHRPMY